MDQFYSHVNYSVTKIAVASIPSSVLFYSHVNYSVTKMPEVVFVNEKSFTVT